jgi:hypothetical protein
LDHHRRDPVILPHALDHSPTSQNIRILLADQPLIHQLSPPDHIVDIYTRPRPHHLHREVEVIQIILLVGINEDHVELLPLPVLHFLDQSRQDIQPSAQMHGDAMLEAGFGDVLLGNPLVLRLDLDAVHVDVFPRARKADTRVAAQCADFEDVLRADEFRLDSEEFALGGGDGDVPKAVGEGVLVRELEGGVVAGVRWGNQVGVGIGVDGDGTGVLFVVCAVDHFGVCGAEFRGSHGEGELLLIV